MDLIIRNARLSDRQSDELMDIGIANGRIATIERGLSAEAEAYDAEGRLACPGLVESHIHLDKSRIIDRNSSCSVLNAKFTCHSWCRRSARDRTCLRPS